jgi:hypothetical protein
MAPWPPRRRGPCIVQSNTVPVTQKRFLINENNKELH